MLRRFSNRLQEDGGGAVLPAPPKSADTVVGVWVSRVENAKATEVPQIWDLQSDGSFQMFSIQPLVDQDFHVEGCLIQGGAWQQEKNEIHIELSDTAFSVQYKLQDGQLVTYHDALKRRWESWQASEKEPIALSVFFNQGLCIEKD